MTTDTPLGPGYRVQIVREFDAPRALVFECMTHAEHMKRWWSPHGFTNPVAESDPRVGGAWEIHMQGPGPFGINPVHGEWIELSPPERMVFSARAFQGEDGRWGIDHVSTAVFEDLPDGRTRMTFETVVKHVSDALLPALGGMEAGWRQSFEKLNGLAAELAMKAAFAQ
ncbi:SRPBCC domain-containing protein [Sphingomonas sp.]|uniref:SRPBCC domain-containing protein n=1 Tax=Sphingomonas sp. TaxID=28214 RepID=UPI001B0B1861|nr:SRPBCC domain-containing protein [Sphingomonas sp.]MBO9711332.1 SRPBCC domain-containing protein [Sphingomonas sp.]